MGASVVQPIHDGIAVGMPSDRVANCPTRTLLLLGILLADQLELR